MESLCNQITIETDPRKVEKLTAELNDLVATTLNGVQPKPAGRRSCDSEQTKRPPGQVGGPRGQ